MSASQTQPLAARGIHPAADLFPKMAADGFETLKKSIAADGLIHPIVLCDGLVLDGRHRYRACLELAAAGVNVEPRFEDFEGDPYRYVWNGNGERRNLDPGTKAAVYLLCETESGSWQQQQQERKAAADGKRSEAARRQHAVSNPRAGETSGLLPLGKTPDDTSPGLVSLGKTPDDADWAHTQLAEQAGVSPRTAARVIALHKNAPDLFEKVADGIESLADATREMVRRDLREKLQGLVDQESIQPTGLYDVIVIDPPWRIQGIEHDESPNQSLLDYPAMSEEELRVIEIPAAESCHVWLWTTHKHLPSGLRLLQAWRLKYVCLFVWHKPGGFQPFGLPQYNCELALYARRGTPSFLDTKDFPLCFSAPRGAHSEKPEAFYETLRRVTAGRRLDMFNRRKIEGFDGHGKEADRTTCNASQMLTEASA